MQAGKNMKKRLFIKEKRNTDILFLFFILFFCFFFFFWLFLLLRDPTGSQRGILFIDDKDFFMDWFNTVYYASGRTPYTWGVAEDRNYAPIVYMLLYPFTRLYPYDISEGMAGEGRYLARYAQLPVVAAVFFLIGSFLMLFYVLYRSSRQRESRRLILLLILFMSGISMNSIERMNIQVLTSALLFAYVYICDRDLLPGKLLTFTGLMCLALPAAFKLFPAIFGILLLYRKHFKEAAAAFILGILTVLLPFLWVDQHFIEAFPAYISGVFRHSSYMTIADFGFSTPMMLELLGGASRDVMQGFALIMLVLSIAGIYFLDSRWKRLALLSLPLILTSGQSGYYCLMFLFLPIVLFFDEEHSPADIIYIIMFVLILSPLQRTAYINGTAVSAKGVINIVLILLNIILVAQAAVSFIHNKRSSGQNSINTK